MHVRCLNIVAHKIQYGVIAAPGVPPPAPLIFKLRDAEKAAAEVARRALAVREGTLRTFSSVVQAIRESLPLSLLYNPAARDFQKFMDGLTFPPHYRPISLQPGDPCAAYQSVAKLAQGVVVVMLRHFEGISVDTMPDPGCVEVVWMLAARLRKMPQLHLVVVSLMNPFYDLRALPPEIPVLVAYDDGHLTMDALTQALNGKSPVSGHVPFILGPRYSPRKLGLPTEAMRSCNLKARL